MPHVTARICGVCPTAHHLAASNALDHACGVTPPPAALLLRELMYLGHIIHSHSLSIFVLQGPDLVMGLDADPAVRNVVGMVRANPERLVWGGDWPHPRVEGEMPDAGHLFELFQLWTPDVATQHRILVTNPAKLYGFPS